MNNKTYAKLFLSFNILMLLLIGFMLFYITDNYNYINVYNIFAFILVLTLIIIYLIALNKTIQKIKLKNIKINFKEIIILIITLILLLLSIIYIGIIPTLILLVLIFIFGFLPVNVFTKLQSLKENVISNIDLIPLICTLVLVIISFLGFIINNDNWSKYVNLNNLSMCILPFAFTNIYSFICVLKKK